MIKLLVKLCCWIRLLWYRKDKEMNNVSCYVPVGQPGVSEVYSIPYATCCICGDALGQYWFDKKSSGDDYGAGVFGDFCWECFEMIVKYPPFVSWYLAGQALFPVYHIVNTIDNDDIIVMDASENENLSRLLSCPQYAVQLMIRVIAKRMVRDYVDILIEEKVVEMASAGD
jgi:hypothetical protein